MTWVRLDDRFPEHPKVAAVGPLEEALHVNALAYAGRNLTDGYIPTRIVPRLIDLDGIGVLHTDRITPIFEPALHRDLVDRLIGAGLWELTETDGFRIHDFLDYNASRSEVEAEREAIEAERVPIEAEWAAVEKARSDGGKTRAATAPRDDSGRFSTAGETRAALVPRDDGGGIIGRRSYPDESAGQSSSRPPPGPGGLQVDSRWTPGGSEREDLDLELSTSRSLSPLPTAAIAETPNLNGNGHRPSHDALYLAERINERWNVSRAGRLTPAGIQRLCSEHGASAVESALRELHGFPPSEAVRKPFAYLRAALENRAAEVAP